MTTENFYDVLGVAKTATEDEIKSAYRKLAVQYHPDKFPEENQEKKDAEAKFKKISEAYQTLSNKDRRTAYDMTGRSSFDNAGSASEESISDFLNNFANFFAREDVFSNGNPAAVAGVVRLTPTEVNTGKEALVNIHTHVACSTCSGMGLDTTKEKIDCFSCGGKGEINAPFTINIVGVNTRTRISCPLCVGTKKSYPRCPSCDGSKRKEIAEKVKVKIPAGIHHGSRVTAKTSSGSSVDIGVEFIFPKDHSIDQLHNISTELKLTYPKVILGGSVNINLYDGNTVTVKIPEGVRPGMRIKLAGKGLYSLRTKKNGDLFFVIQMDIVDAETDEEKELLEKLEKIYEKRKSNNERSKNNENVG